MKRRVLSVLAAMGVTLCGCQSFEQGFEKARIFDGNLDQGPRHDIQLSVTPAMARCEALHQGAVVGSYDAEKGVLSVPVAQNGLDIFCSAGGYKDKRVAIVPDNAGRGTWAFVLQDFFAYTPSYPFSLKIELEPEGTLGLPV